MQLIRNMAMTAVQYVEKNFHFRVCAPDPCPRCGAMGGLNVLGYYSRNLTGEQATVVRISIRRFRCRQCRKSTSVLPSFIQPYRLLQNFTIDRFFSSNSPIDALWWQPLLKQYWNRFLLWIPELAARIGLESGRGPPHADGPGWWKLLVDSFGDLEKITQHIVQRYGITVFGRYRCHSSDPERKKTCQF